MNTEHNKKAFLEYYHMGYPKNINFMRVHIGTLDQDNKHVKAMQHFLNCLEENESGMIYGMLNSAYDKLIEETLTSEDFDYTKIPCKSEQGQVSVLYMSIVAILTGIIAGQSVIFNCLDKLINVIR